MKEDRKFLIIAVLSCVFVWLADAAWDHFIFKKPFIDAFLVAVPPQKIVFRIFLMIAILFVAMTLSRRSLRSAPAGSKLPPLSDILDQSAEGLCVADMDGTVRSSNKAFARMHGYSPEEVVGKHLSIFHSPQQIPAIEEANRKLTKEGVFNGEVWHARRDGTVFLSWMHNAIFRDQAGIPAGMIGTLQDITERKKSEEALLVAVREWKETFDAISDSVIVLDKDYRIVRANRATEEFLKRPEKEIIGRRCHELVHGTPSPPELCPMSRAIHTKEREEWEVQLPDGGPWLAVAVDPILDDKGEISGFVHIVKDVTVRKGAERVTRESIERFDLVARATNDTVWDWNLLTDDIWWNEGMQKVFGYRAEEIEPTIESWYKRIHPEDKEQAVSSIHAVIDGGGMIWSCEYRFRNSDSSYAQVIDRGYIIRDDSGKAIRMVGAMLNITERRAAEALLSEREEFLRSVLKAVPVGVGLVADKAIKWVNESFQEIIGYAKEEVIGKNISIVYESDKEFDRVRNEIYGELAQKGFSEKEVRWKHKQGSLRDMLLSVSPIDRRDLSRGMVFAAMDVTERNKAEKELDNYRKQLEEMVKERTEELESFSYSVSHDLRAPIRAIDGFTRILADEFGDKLDQEGKRLIDVIVASTKNMGRLVDDLLAFSRIGRREAQHEEMDMELIARDMAEGLIRESEGRKVELKMGHLPAAFGDRAMIQLVLVNLLSNALKFTRKKENARIEIGAEEKDGMIAYFVRDNGVGFDMKYVSKLFGVFQRLHSQEEFEGIGIGLATVKRIISKHGGRVGAEGEVGKGATFFFSLPIHRK